MMNLNMIVKTMVVMVNMIMKTMGANNAWEWVTASKLGAPCFNFSAHYKCFIADSSAQNAPKAKNIENTLLMSIYKYILSENGGGDGDGNDDDDDDDGGYESQLVLAILSAHELHSN